MKKTYYIALERTEKPFVSWLSIGYYTSSEFAASDYATNQLIVVEDDLPSYAFGVSMVHIVSGRLVERTAAEMAVFEKEYNTIFAINAIASKIFDVNIDSFEYEIYKFPMDEVSRLFYSMIAQLPGDYDVLNMDNEIITIGVDKNNKFLRAYYDKLLLITKH